MTNGVECCPSRPDRGAAAVEFAIILPLLLILVAGIVDFGRLLYAEVMVTNAAREGARMLAMGYPASDADARAAAASPNMGVVGGLGAPSRITCPANPAPTTAASYTVRIASFDWLLLDAFAPISAPQPESTATMRCRG